MGTPFFHEEHNMFRQSVRKFVEAEIVPHHAQWEQDGMVSREVWRKAGESGFLCMEVPEEYGGAGLDHFGKAIVLEAAGYSMLGTPLVKVDPATGKTIRYVERVPGTNQFRDVKDERKSLQNGLLYALAVMATLAAHEGAMDYTGCSILGQGAWDLVSQGLVMVPEGRGTFARMSIVENLQMGAFVRRDGDIQADMDRVFELFPRLKERARQLAGTMSGGEQQMLAMGRALMARPKLLLLDEPSMGLSPIMVDKVFEVISDIHRQGTTVLLVEQNASRALGLANRGYVMDSGEITMSGPAAELLQDPRVRAAYLGE